MTQATSEPVPFLGPLQPWEVSNLHIYLPPTSESSSPYDISLAILNPNVITAGPAPHASGGGYLLFGNSTANCTGREVFPDSRPMECTEISEYESYGAWSFEATKGSSTSVASPSGIDIKFILDYNVTRWGSTYYKVLKGTGHFDLETDMTQHCDPKGGCTLTLKPNRDPFLILANITQCWGTCATS
ncbi:hypothetical protein HD806DRAFT_552248 [Xylariaceae sp. AK1471]|nr:hypothetical protein HD806DRAFT_552248 [Xylariaceae sp. AK1471]